MQKTTNRPVIIEWRDGQPYSSLFQDVYFSSDNGALETDYVFLQGNNLAKRWFELHSNHFVIAETGFGSGLNFICAAKLWLATAPKDATLHFISTERYPLSLQDITAALQPWPELHEFSAPLIASYKSICNGEPTNMLYGNRVQLSLLIGDATESFKALVVTDDRINPAYPKIDAWFLDGFSPVKNPDMWQPALFEQMAWLSKQESTFATFTSAGGVRRGLLAAGFEVSKQAGFGKKREMLFGRFTGHTNATVVSMVDL